MAEWGQSAVTYVESSSIDEIVSTYCFIPSLDQKMHSSWSHQPQESNQQSLSQIHGQNLFQLAIYQATKPVATTDEISKYH